MATIPSVARIVELQLAIELVQPDDARTLNRKRKPAPTLTEMWKGRIALAPVCAADFGTLAAFIETLDGRAGTFSVVMKRNFSTHDVTVSAVVSGAVVSGADRVNVTLASAATLPAGTLVAFGVEGTAAYQVCEVLQDVAGKGVVSVLVAPRIRKAIASGAAAVFGQVDMALALLKDDTAPSYALHHGTYTLDVVEAL